MSRHVNNVRYVRWIETARIRYAESLELPGGQVRGMLVSLSTLHVDFPSQSKEKEVNEKQDNGSEKENDRKRGGRGQRSEREADI
jgi:hypothetical protein